jgi:colanic acid/amylovoran biosynthesis glycosyltransferase
VRTEGPRAEPGRPTVAVWADHWLPLSQTFVMNQVAATRRWNPVTIGLSSLPDGLPVTPDLAPFSTSLSSRAMRRIVGTRGHLRTYTAFLRERRVSVLHAHFGPGGINALPLARSAGQPLLVTFHGYDVTQLPRRAGRRGRLYRRQLRDLFERADQLVAVSGHIRRQLLELGAPEGKITVHHVGAPAPHAGAELLPSRTSCRTGITFVGRLIEKKGVDDILAAVALLPAPLSATPVSILGSGEEGTRLLRLATTLGVNATFHGSATPGDVAAALDTAAVFCGPSKSAADGDTEGLPTTLIEAAHHGATIVSTRHAGIPEFVRDNVEALLVDEGDVAALSAALALALTDRDRAAKLARRAQARAQTHFEIGACTARLETLYDRLTQAE